MRSRIPILATLLVLAAVGAMIALGVWQLHRKAWKEALLAHYHAALSTPAEVSWPRDHASAERLLYRRSRVDCRKALNASSMAGKSAAGESGIAHVVTCSLAGGGEAMVVLGWSRDVKTPEWRGGEVTGFIAPGGSNGARLIADPPVTGLQANARPDPANIPNNHFSYAVQWFLFAVTALVIYALALRKRLKG